MTTSPFRHIRRFLALLLLGVAATPSWGAGELLEDEPLFLDVPAQVATGHLPRPVSQIAENVTVITAEQIALLNAHTLADVLQTVPGIQLDVAQTPGSFVGFFINGFSFQHVQVLIDGIPQNDILSNFSDTGTIPAHQIERVEIVKGAASAAWGSALGGVVNVITKSPDPERKLGGGGFASYGERKTSDLNGEVSGTLDRFGYYLGGGNLHSEGHLPGNGVNINSMWGKFTYVLPDKGTITLGGSLRDGFRGLEENESFNFRDTTNLRHYNLFAAFSQPLNRELTLDLTARLRYQDETTVLGSIVAPDPDPFAIKTRVRQLSPAATAALRWDNGTHNAVAGLEYKHHEVRSDFLGTDFFIDRKLDPVSAYLNAAFSFGPLTVLPGLRYDHTGVGKEAYSYTLGATWRLTDRTVLRGYGARGYSLPTISPANQNQTLQDIWTVQAGFETSEIPYLWLKGTLFYNDVWNLESLGFVHGEQIRQGFEVEARTVPLYGFSLSGGYTLTDARDRGTKDRVEGIPWHSAKVAFTYKNDRLGLSGVMTGNYVWWNQGADFFGAVNYKPVIWDATLTQKLFPGKELSPELFFSGHNLFNGGQYSGALFKNAPRWIEGGVRFRF